MLTGAPMHKPAESAALPFASAGSPEFDTSRTLRNVAPIKELQQSSGSLVAWS